MYPIVIFDTLRVKIRDADSRMVKIEPLSAIGPRTMAGRRFHRLGRDPGGGSRGSGSPECRQLEGSGFDPGDQIPRQRAPSSGCR
jgi:hypothetical protein